MTVMYCKLCEDFHGSDPRDCPCRCGGCGCELDGTGECGCGCSGSPDTLPSGALAAPEEVQSTGDSAPR